MLSSQQHHRNHNRCWLSLSRQTLRLQDGPPGDRTAPRGPWLQRPLLGALRFRLNDPAESRKEDKTEPTRAREAGLTFASCCPAGGTGRRLRRGNSPCGPQLKKAATGTDRRCHPPPPQEVRSERGYSSEASR